MKLCENHYTERCEMMEELDHLEDREEQQKPRNCTIQLFRVRSIFKKPTTFVQIPKPLFF